MLLTEKLNIQCDFCFGFTRCEGCNLLFVSLYVALETVSGMKAKKVVEGVKTAVSTWVGFRSSPGMFFLGM